MRVIIAGGRDFDNQAMLNERCDNILCNQESVTIVCGMARGADTLGLRYAEERGYKVDRYPADWTAHGKSAGYKRNEKMAQNADGLIAFWDGKSKGTKHMIDLANQYGLKIRIVRY